MRNVKTDSCNDIDEATEFNTLSIIPETPFIGNQLLIPLSEGEGYIKREGMTFIPSPFPSFTSEVCIGLQNRISIPHLRADLSPSYFLTYSSRRGLTAFSHLRFSSAERVMILIAQFKGKLFSCFIDLIPGLSLFLNPFLIDLFDDLLDIRRQGIPLLLVHDHEEAGAVRCAQAFRGKFHHFSPLPSLQGFLRRHRTVDDPSAQGIIGLTHGHGNRSSSKGFHYFCSQPVQRIFIPLTSSSLLTGFLVWRIPGPWAWRYITLTSSNSLGLNFL